MAALYNDGNVPYGSQVLTINAVTYVAEGITPKNPTKVIERRNELDEPSGQVLVQDFITGSAVLQLAAANTAMPTPGLTFTADFLGAGSNQTWILSEVSPPLAQADAHKVNIEFRKKIN